MSDPAVAHFDRIAGDYDFWKKKNWYYYSQVISVVNEKIGKGRRVIEVGCGTGDILASLQPSWGMGIDPSRGMLDEARRKWKEMDLHFATPDEVLPHPPVDAIVLTDVVEHVHDPEELTTLLKRLAGPETRIVFTMANSLWEPILLLLEALKMKMPEGPHRRRFYRTWKRILERAGFTVGRREFRCLIPHPAFDRLNAFARNLPLISRLMFIEIFEARRAATS